MGCLLMLATAYVVHRTLVCSVSVVRQFPYAFPASVLCYASHPWSALVEVCVCKGCNLSHFWRIWQGTDKRMRTSAFHALQTRNSRNFDEWSKSWSDIAGVHIHIRTTYDTILLLANVNGILCSLISKAIIPIMWGQFESESFEKLQFRRKSVPCRFDRNLQKFCHKSLQHTLFPSV